MHRRHGEFPSRKEPRQRYTSDSTNEPWTNSPYILGKPPLFALDLLQGRIRIPGTCPKAVAISDVEVRAGEVRGLDVRGEHAAGLADEGSAGVVLALPTRLSDHHPGSMAGGT